jgi:cytidylate kinase
MIAAMQIAIIGNAGSGKTTFAQSTAAKHRLAVLHLGPLLCSLIAAAPAAAQVATVPPGFNTLWDIAKAESYGTQTFVVTEHRRYDFQIAFKSRILLKQAH